MLARANINIANVMKSTNKKHEIVENRHRDLRGMLIVC